MAAYMIGNIEVLDAEHYPEYAKLAAPTVAKYGGRYLARGGSTAVKEGDAKAHRVVILEFPTLARALDASVRQYRLLRGEKELLEETLRGSVRVLTEVLSLAGDIALEGRQPKLHLHAVLGRRDGSTVGGHLLTGVVRPTLEAFPGPG